MAAAVESNKTCGKFGHMHLILDEKEYRIATKNASATVDLLPKLPNIHPDFQALTKDQLTKYKFLQLEDETKQKITAYLTQEETSKEIVQRMVASIEPDCIKDLNNKYKGYNNKTPKSLLAHIAENYCKTTVTDQLQAVSEFANPWDQVTNLSTWITRLERQRQKCDKVGVVIDNGRMVLKITENATIYALFTTTDHKAYDNLTNHDLTKVIKFWVKKYKAHNTYQWNQIVTDQYESVTYSGPPPNLTVITEDYEATYISALEETVKQLATEKDTAYTVKQIISN